MSQYKYFDLTKLTAAYQGLLSFTAQSEKIWLKEFFSKQEVVYLINWYSNFLSKN